MGLRVRLVAIVVAVSSAAVGAEIESASAQQPPAERANITLGRMSQSEKLSLLRGVLGRRGADAISRRALSDRRAMSREFRGSAFRRLQETDAELGVANPGTYSPRRRSDRHAVESRPRFDLGRGGRAAARRSGRGGGAGPGLQRAARRRRQSRSRSARRPHLRIFIRGPAADRTHGGRGDRRRPEPACHLDDQAFRPQRSGDRQGRARCADRPRRAARIGPARLRDRRRAGPARAA